ncbi:hypothetical protein GCM10009641_09410 [Mycobacterium cookii]|uniref:Secreted protein n=1 Tax=Mycobacterium cookii TaxID=1775 RepID=A0A7I7L0Z4_9MYCO|nr:hypothetical protein [Mycobacterium cookii]MCV7329871.1 hypothetical protein [Mycobacterium cookii]BBX48015.1 hypothetical protein MCOO_40300 [Mycobacterium cookii]
MKRLICGAAAGVLVWGGVAGVLGAGTAQASTWCPGQYVWPGLRATGWDLSVCHEYHEQCPIGVHYPCPDYIAEGPEPPTPPGLNFCPIPPWCP